jgi:toxin ParE1/3/4
VTEYKLTIRATQDLEDAYEYLYKLNPDAALKLLQALKERCTSLADMPGQGRQRNEFNEFVKVKGLRSAAENNYTIFYQQTTYGVLILRILHHSRDVEQIFTPGSSSEQVVE